MTAPTTPPVALVTGAAHRIGRAIALDLARRGHDIGVHYHRSQREAEALVTEIRALGRRAIALPANLTDETQVQTLIPALSGALGPVTLLINNASLFERDEIADATRASWDAHMETNLRAPFALTQALAAQLPPDRSGLVINLLDQRVWNLTPHFVSYTLSKAGLWTLTQTLALALAPRIRVNGIGPGPALRSVHQTEEQFDRQCATMPLGIGTNPAEICQAVAFIQSSPSMTGQMIALDGGQHLAWSFRGTGQDGD